MDFPWVTNNTLKGEKSAFKKRKQSKTAVGKLEERGKRRDEHTGIKSRSKGEPRDPNGLRSADATRRPAR